MAEPFSPMILGLQELGIYLYLFPFLLTLAIVFGVLSYALKEQLPTSARGVISIIIAFFVMLFSVWYPGIVVFFANLFGFGLIAGSGLLLIVILLAFMGIKPADIASNEKAKWTFTAALIFIALLITAAAVGTAMFGTAALLQTSEFWTIIFFVIILALVMLFFGKSG